MFTLKTLCLKSVRHFDCVNVSFPALMHMDTIYMFLFQVVNPQY